MASRKEVTVHLPEIYNVTEMLSSNGAGNYNCVQGYTTSAVSDVVHFITAKPDSADDNAAVGNILDQNITVSKNVVTNTRISLFGEALHSLTKFLQPLILYAT